MRISALVFALLLTPSVFADSNQFSLHPVTNDLIVPQTAAPRILIPAAGDAPGQNGTHFRTDVDIINLRQVDQTVQLRWLPQGRSGAGIAVRTVILPELSGISSENFVSEIMQQSGLGSIEIVGVTAQGVFDEGARLHVTARIWTPVPTTVSPNGGRMSQTFPAIIYPTAPAVTKAAFGLRHSTFYRLNIGVVNQATVTQRFRITAFVTGTREQGVLEIDIDPQSMNQFNFPLTTTGLVQIVVTNLTGASSTWHAYGSSVDNISGDAWSQMAFPGE